MFFWSRLRRVFRIVRCVRRGKYRDNFYREDFQNVCYDYRLEKKQIEIGIFHGRYSAARKYRFSGVFEIITVSKRTILSQFFRRKPTPRFDNIFTIN